MITIKTNADDFAHTLRDVATNRLPSVLRNAINDTAKDVMNAERAAMSRVFDRPTPFILNGLRVTQWAKKEDLTAVVAFKDDASSRKNQRNQQSEEGPAYDALTPHIPGYPSQRRMKGLEKWLQSAGYISDNEWMVPTRAVKKDVYGNVPAAVISKMLQDIGAYKNTSGFFNARTGKGTTKRSKQKVALYRFGVVKYKHGSIKGIWWIIGGAKNYETKRWVPMMIATKKTPSYSKRYDFHGIAQQQVNDSLPQHVARWSIDLNR